jgi:endoglucanase
MKNYVIKRCAAVLAAAAIITTAAPVMQFSANAANLISNSTFDSGTSGWSCYKQNGGSCSLSTENGKLALKVSNVGEVNYSVQVGYDIVPLYQNGVYRLKYDISSTVNRRVEGMIQMNGGDYRAYTWKGIDLTSTPQTVDYTFTMDDETDIMAKLVFNCGTQGTDLPEHTIYIDNVSLELIDDSNVDYGTTAVYETPIVTNQVGYKTDAQKTAVVRNISGSGDGASCSVVNADTNQVVYTGYLSGGTQNSSADEYDYVFDFSDVTASGNYYITCSAVSDASYTFAISDNPYQNLLDDSVRMLYLQRCGTTVSDSTFGHTACHNTAATVYGTNETIDVSGGWHDAGDYGRYVVPGAKAVADLLYAYDANPNLYSDNIGIPESGNGVPDILDEARYELEWMLKMQSSSGGVYHKVTCENFPAYIMPEYETDQLIVTPVSTTATADFCAAMAMAYEFYYDVDSSFANKCLNAAEKAWSFLEANPNLIFSNPSDITTGEYGDTSDKDERYWAAAQMYRATGESKYLTAFENMSAKTGMDWSLVGDYGNIAILTMDGIDTNSTAYTKAKNAVVSQASSFAKKSASSPYGSAITKYNWGSNMTIADAGVILSLAYNITGDEQYADAASSQLNYLLGSNPLGECFVTGYGTVSPQNPHHRPSMAKSQAMPGMLVGGVNSSLEDSAAKAYLAGTPSAKCYVDNSESYSTNEITIYWNSPLTYLISLTESADSSVKGDVNADGAFNVSDALMMQRYLLGAGTLTNASNGDVCEDNCLDSLDMVVMRQMLAGSSSGSSNSSSSGNSNNSSSGNSSGTVTSSGTTMNSNATAVADFRNGSSSLFYASDGWSNGSCFNCVWRGSNATFKDNALNLTIDKDSKGEYNYSGAEYRTTDFYGYGYYETSMQAIKNNGVVSSFFTYTGPSDNNPWDEIDVEILGKDTTKVQFNYYTNGVGNHEYMYDLGFDASQGYHTYGFDWQSDHITWYVDGKAVYTAYSNIPSTPGKIMMNVWPGTGVDDWLNAYDGTTPLTAKYQWVTYNK